MARQYRYLKGSKDASGNWQFNPKTSGSAIEADFPSCARSSEHYAQVAFKAAYEFADERDEPLEYEFLFYLARQLMATTKAEFRREEGFAARLAPFALIYLETLMLLDREPADNQILEWDDDEQVLEYFEAVYGKTKFAADENLPEFVMNQAIAHPLRIKGLTEKRLKLLSFAYHLQRMQGDANIFLPVETLGKLLGCSATFVSQLLDNARTSGHLVSQGDYVKKVLARPYRFDMARLSKAQLPKSK